MDQIVEQRLTPATCRAARGLLAISQAELARRAGVSRLTVADFERGERTPTRASDAALRRVFEAEGIRLLADGAVRDALIAASPARRLAIVLQNLQAAETRLKKLGVRHVAVFGSLARGEARPTSDVDLLIDLDPKARIDVFDYAGIAGELAELVPGPVDIARRDRLKPEIRRRADADAIRAF